MSLERINVANWDGNSTFGILDSNQPNQAYGQLVSETIDGSPDVDRI